MKIGVRYEDGTIEDAELLPFMEERRLKVIEAGCICGPELIGELLEHPDLPPPHARLQWWHVDYCPMGQEGVRAL